MKSDQYREKTLSPSLLKKCEKIDLLSETMNVHHDEYTNDDIFAIKSEIVEQSIIHR